MWRCPVRGLVLPSLFAWPVLVTLEGSDPVPVTPDQDRTIEQITLIVDSVEYTLRLLVAQDTTIAALPSTVSGFADVVDIANSSTENVFQILEPVPSQDSMAHALATFMALDRTISFLSCLAMNETGSGRVKTTSECRDLVYPISPLAAFVRALFRV